MISASPFDGFSHSVFFRVENYVDHHDLYRWCKENCDGDFAIAESNSDLKISFFSMQKIKDPFGGMFEIQPTRSSGELFVVLFDKGEDRMKFLLTYAEEKGN